MTSTLTAYSPMTPRPAETRARSVERVSTRKHTGRYWPPLAAVMFLLAALAPSVAPAAASSAGTWALTGSMAAARFGATATMLADGLVLIAGGCCGATGNDLASAELYDPSTGTFTATGSMLTARAGAASTLLSNGQVLVAGGVNSTGPVSSAELYSPSNGTWAPTGSMTIPRFGHKATLLPDGRVLVTGNCDSTSACASAELYDPATGTWTATATMTAGREDQTATLLSDGRVLIAGGGDVHGSPLASAELYDPRTGAFTPTGNMVTARYGHTATLLPNGQVLIVGGCCDSHGNSLASAELYDPTTGAFAPTGSMATARTYHVTRLLSTGYVLVDGGLDDHSALASAQLYDPGTGAFTATGSMSTVRWGDTATVLPDGQVLVAGGEAGDGPDLASAELYTPLAPVALPATTASLVPVPNGAGWNNSPVTVSLSATDAGAPISATYEAADNAACAPFAPALCSPYTAPFSVSGEGRHTVYFYSVDATGANEAQRGIALNIDATPPSTTASLSGTLAGGSYLASVQITLSATDTLSGVALTQYQLDGGPLQSYSGPITVTARGSHVLTFYSTDSAGNVEQAHSQGFTIGVAVLMATPVSATPFQTITLTGTGFSATEPVHVYWDGISTPPLTSITTTPAGGFVTGLTVPQAISSPHTLIAVGQDSDLSATAMVRVKPFILVPPYSGRAGSTIIGEGFGFGANEPVQLFWDKPRTFLGSATTNSLGSFYGASAIAGTVPLSATTGVHYILAIGQTSHAAGVSRFYVHT